MAEKVTQVPTTACTAIRKKRMTKVGKSWTEKRLDKARGQTRVNISVAFQRWQNLRELKGLKREAEFAIFLLDR